MDRGEKNGEKGECEGDRHTHTYTDSNAGAFMKRNDQTSGLQRHIACCPGIGRPASQN